MEAVNKETKPVVPESTDEHSKNLFNSFSEKPEKTQLSMNQEGLKRSNLNLGISLGGIYDEVLEEKPLARSSSSVAGLIKTESVELGVLPSLERSQSMPVMGKQQDHGETIKVEGMETDARNGLEKQGNPNDNVVKKRVIKQTVEEVMPSSPSKIAAWAIASAVKNPALCRAMAIIKAGEACMAPKRLKLGLEAENTRKSPAIHAVKGTSSSKTSFAGKEGSNSLALLKQEDVKLKVISDDGKFVKPADRKPENGSKKPAFSIGIADDGKFVKPADRKPENGSKKPAFSNGIADYGKFVKPADRKPAFSIGIADDRKFVKLADRKPAFSIGIADGGKYVKPVDRKPENGSKKPAFSIGIADDGKFVKPADRKPANGSKESAFSIGIADDEKFVKPANGLKRPIFSNGIVDDGKFVKPADRKPANGSKQPIFSSGIADDGKFVKPADCKPANGSKEPIFSTGIADDGKFVKPADRKLENASKEPTLSNGIAGDEAMEMMRKMPSVTATGDGPNGRRIEGFLYNYLKGEVTIVCICHGHFLSPEGFVRHAGCMDVSNPTRRIKICPSNF